MAIRSSFFGLAIGALITIPCLAFAIYAGGAGHGTYAPAKLLFPFAMLAATVGQSITAPFIAAGCVQFPLYGLILGSSVGSSRFRILAVSIVLLHLAVVVFVFARSGESFT